MQFDPESYPVADYKFNASSTLGIIAREYEVTQLVQLLQTMQQDTPLYTTLVQSIIDNMNLSNREELLSSMQEALQPNPQEQEAFMAEQQAQIEFQQSQTAALSAQAQESMARASKLSVEADTVPKELEIDLINAITRNLREGDQEDKEFERRLRVAETLLRERELKSKENANKQRTGSTPEPNDRRLKPKWDRLEALEQRIFSKNEDINEKEEGPKTSKSRSKRVQQTKKNA